MSDTDAENRLIVERLLGWKVETTKLGDRFRSPTNWTGYMAGMNFTTGDDMLLLLDAMAKRYRFVSLEYSREEPCPWLATVMYEDVHGESAREITAPAAVRAAALEVCKALPK